MNESDATAVTSVALQGDGDSNSKANDEIYTVPDEDGDLAIEGPSVACDTGPTGELTKELLRVDVPEIYSLE